MGFKPINLILLGLQGVRLKELDGKVVLISGGTDGIGLLLADILLKNHAKVAINGDCPSRGIHAWITLQERGNEDVAFISGNISDYGDCRRIVGETVGHFNRIDGVVNCEEMLFVSNDWARRSETQILTSNINKANFLSEFVSPEMQKVSGGVVLTASTEPREVSVFYRAPKHNCVSQEKVFGTGALPGNFHLKCECYGDKAAEILAVRLPEIKHTQQQYIEKLRNSYRIKGDLTAQEAAQVVCFLLTAILTSIQGGNKRSASNLLVG